MSQDPQEDLGVFDNLVKVDQIVQPRETIKYSTAEGVVNQSPKRTGYTTPNMERQTH